MDPLYLFAAMFWGSIGMGFFIYGKKQKRPVPLIGGIMLMAICYIVKTPFYLSMASVALIAGIYFISKRM